VQQGIIQQSLSGFFDVLCDGAVYRTRGRGNFRKRGIKPIVGDQVEFADGYLLKVLPRKNQLRRPPVSIRQSSLRPLNSPSFPAIYWIVS